MRRGVRSVRLTVELDGKATVVDVADDLGSVRVGDRSFPLRVVARAPLRVELDIAGETVVVAGWPERSPLPPGPVDVNGERWAAGIAVAPSEREGTAGAARPVPSSAAGPASAPGPSAGPLPEGTPVLPPMPGRVVELRVRDGQAVGKGDVLLVLEAMKMRNEVAAPVDGVVVGVRVAEGANVRARETMLVIAPART